MLGGASFVILLRNFLCALYFFREGSGRGAEGSLQRAVCRPIEAVVGQRTGAGQFVHYVGRIRVVTNEDRVDAGFRGWIT